MLSLSRLFKQTSASDYRCSLIANMNFRVCMISVYSANTRAIRIKIKIEPSFTQRLREFTTMLALFRIDYFTEGQSRYFGV